MVPWGGVDIRYWKDRRRHLKNLEMSLGRQPIAGVDYPTDEQMRLAQEFAKKNH